MGEDFGLGDMFAMGFRQPTPAETMTAQYVSMLRMIGQDNAQGLASILNSFTEVAHQMGYGLNVAVSPDGDELGLMVVQLNPDRVDESFTPGTPGVDAAIVASFGEGSVDTVLGLVRSVRNDL